MPGCLIDASTTLAWLFNEEGRGRSLDQQLEPLDLVAPWLWRLEVVNAVLVRERRKHITQAQGTRLLEAIEAMEIEIIDEPQNRSLAALAQLARPHQLTSYDAVYLDLAISLGLPLLTNDANLLMAADRVGVPVIPPASA
jgi:predicted nucleic acid-binding protein